jgi:predicted ATPase
VLLLRAIEPKPANSQAGGFPYDMAVLQSFRGMALTSPVTFLVGENGSGKSTFLEALACAVGSRTVGSESVDTDPTLADVRRFAHDQLKLVWSKRTRAGFFMRSEDFFGFAKRMSQALSELEQNVRDVEDDYAGRSEFAKGLARLPYKREIAELRRSYGEGLDTNSHGEGFFKLFRSRFSGEGLYLLDEPEAPLSPTRQLSLLAMIKQMVDQRGQFIIATHSPILMAYPGAAIFSFDDGVIQPVAYEQLEHVIITRNFLNSPETYLRHLFEA